MQMSFGTKLRAAIAALKTAGLPPDLRPKELHGRILDELQKQGHKPSELPHPRTIARYLERLEQQQRAEFVTLCHVHPGAADGISDVTTEPPTQDDDMHQSNSRSMINITGSVRVWHQVVPFDHGIDEILRKDYFDANYLQFQQGDRIELWAGDFSFTVEFLVVAVNRAARSVTTYMTEPPRFLLQGADTSPPFLASELQRIQNELRDNKIGSAEYEGRRDVLMSLRDHGRYPTKWIADKLMQLDRALDGGRLPASSMTGLGRSCSPSCPRPRWTNSSASRRSRRPTLPPRRRPRNRPRR